MFLVSTFLHFSMFCLIKGRHHRHRRPDGVKGGRKSHAAYQHHHRPPRSPTRTGTRTWIPDNQEKPCFYHPKGMKIRKNRMPCRLATYQKLIPMAKYQCVLYSFRYPPNRDALFKYVTRNEKVRLLRIKRYRHSTTTRGDATNLAVNGEVIGTIQEVLDHCLHSPSPPTRN